MDRVEFRQLRTFEAICKNLSFSKAALDLGYSQSAVTIQIQQLEEEFQTRLFERIGRTVRLTAEGERFREKAQKILREVGELEASAGQATEVHTPVRIGAIDSLAERFLLDGVKEFLSRNPAHAVSITTASPEQLIHMLNRNQLDLIYILDRAVDDLLWEKPLEKDEPIVFVTARGSALAKRHPRTLSALREEPFLLTEKADNYRRALEQTLARKGLAFHTILEVPETDIICRLVCEGYGVSFLPEFVVQPYVNDGCMEILSIEDYVLTMQRQLIYHTKKWVHRDMKEFMEIMMKEE